MLSDSLRACRFVKTKINYSDRHPCKIPAVPLPPSYLHASSLVMAPRRPLLASLVLARCALSALALSASSIRMSADVPVALRPLQRQEIVDKLDGVPVFSVVNRQTQQVVPTAAENGVLCCYFHVDVDEAAASLAKLQARNPTLELGLTATPLGTAYALCEWERQASQEDGEEDSEALGLADGDDYEDDPDAPKIELRLQAPLRLRASAPLHR